MKKLKVCFVGCGRYCREWLEAMPQVREAAEPIAVVDTDFDRALNYQRRFNVPYAYSSVQEAIDARVADAFVLVLPHHLHHDLAIQCMRAGYHVIVEKILSLSYADSKDMARVAAECGVKLMSSQTQRFATGHKAAHDLIASGELGEVFNITASFRSCIPEPAAPWWTENAKVGDGFIIPMKGSHSVDLYTWFLGGKIPVRVYAQARRMKDCWEGKDEVVFTLTYENGTTVMEHMTYNTDRDSNCQCEKIISGTKGLLTTDTWGRRICFNGKEERFKENSLEFIANLMSEFASAIREHREPIASGAEVAPVNAIIEAIVRSAETNLPVNMQEMYPELF